MLIFNIMSEWGRDDDRLAVSLRRYMSASEWQAISLVRTILRNRDDLVVIGPYYQTQPDFLHPKGQGTILVAPQEPVYSLDQMLALEKDLVRRLRLIVNEEKYYPCTRQPNYMLGHMETETFAGKNFVYFYPSVKLMNLATICAGASLIARQSGTDIVSSAESTSTVRTQLVFFSSEVHVLCKEVFEGKVSPQEIQRDYEKWLIKVNK